MASLTVKPGQSVQIVFSDQNDFDRMILAYQNLSRAVIQEVGDVAIRRVGTFHIDRTLDLGKRNLVIRADRITSEEGVKLTADKVTFIAPTINFLGEIVASTFNRYSESSFFRRPIPDGQPFTYSWSVPLQEGMTWEIEALKQSQGMNV
jgi:hypothetical protein